MFMEGKVTRKWSDIGFIALVISIAATVVLSILDAILKGNSYGAGSGVYYFLATLITDFRYFFEQGFYAATIFFVGAKFFETRTILTIGFDKMDSSRILLKGPDDENVVWVGHRYGTKLEAEAVSAALSERLKRSAIAEAEA